MSRGSRSGLILVYALLFATSSLSQTHGEDHAMARGLPLHSTSRVAILAEANRPIYKHARCDAQGNIYFRAYQADDRRVPVIRADAKGSIIRYSLDADPAFAGATSYDFSVLPNGNVYQPVQAGEDVLIVGFDERGGIRQKIKLEKQFWVARLAALNEQSFLVLGTELRRDKQPPAAVVAIFDAQGRLLRNVNLDAGVPILPALSSDSEVTPDGVAHLMLPANPVLVYSVDSTGEVKNSFKINPPGPKMTATSMNAVNGRLAILFRESFRGMQHNDAGVILVVDASSGVEISRYAVGPELGSTLACYTADSLVFIGSENDKLAIQHSSIK